MLLQMKQLFFAELKENVTGLQETFSKIVFMMKRMKEVFPINLLSVKIFFHICASEFKINKRQATSSMQLVFSSF